MSKLSDFFVTTTSNEGMSEAQYSLYDKQMDRFSYYCQQEGLDKYDLDVREDYFTVEISNWDLSDIELAIKTFNL